MSRKHRESSQTRARSKNNEFDNGRTKLENLKEQGGMQSPTCSTCDFDSCGPEASRSGRFCRWAGDVEFLLRTRQAVAWPIQRSEKRVHLAPQERKLSETASNCTWFLSCGRTGGQVFAEPRQQRTLPKFRIYYTIVAELSRAFAVDANFLSTGTSSDLGPFYFVLPFSFSAVTGR